MAVLAVLAGLLAAAPSSAAGIGNISGDIAVQVDGNPSHDITVPAGAQKQFILTYSCNGGPCTNVRITAAFDPDAQVGTASFNPSTTTESRSGNVVTYTIASLNQGSAGQITVSVVMPAWTTPDQTTVQESATFSSLGGQTTSHSVDVHIGAGTESHAEIDKLSGGAVGQTTTYQTKACVDYKLPGETYGPLGIAAGSTLVATIPDGATVVDAGGGTIDSGTITWTLPAINAYGCTAKSFLVLYDPGTPGNELGSHKSTTATWTGNRVSESTTELGTDTFESELSEPNASEEVIMEVTTPRFDNSRTPNRSAAIADNVVQSFVVTNTGTATWDSATISSPIVKSLKPTAIGVDGIGGPAELWISRNGGPLEKAYVVDSGSSVNLDLTAGSMQTGWLIPEYTNSDVVTNVELRLTNVPAGASKRALNITGKVLENEFGTGTHVDNGLVYGVAGRFTRTALGVTPTPRNFDEEFIIDGAMSMFFGMTGGEVVSSPDDREVDNTYFAVNSGQTQIKNPVVMLIAQPGVTLSNVVATPRGTAPENTPSAPTRTVLNNYPTAGHTLYRWTWPTGTILEPNGGLDLTFHETLPRAFYNRVQVIGMINSKTDTFGCSIGNYWASGENDFGAPADFNDNGRTGDWACVWGINLDPVWVTQGQVVQSVKGFWDDEFQDGPATSYSRPNRQDELRSSLQNTGNIFLKDAVLVTKLPRPGDKLILDDTTERNPSTVTFPVHLMERPTVPTLGSPVTTYWTDVENPCFTSELGSTASGCNAANWRDWDTTAPTTVGSVTAMKFDFGANQLTPYDQWNVDMKVTTPEYDASASPPQTEPEYAVINPGGGALDEKAYGTSAARFRSAAGDVLQQPVEALAVGLDMPDALGPDRGVPTAIPVTSSGPVVTQQGVTARIPKGADVVIYDGGAPVSGVLTGGSEVTTLTTEEGTYTINRETGALTFTPVAGFVGPAQSINYQITDTRGRVTYSTYTPTVIPPTPPAPTPAATSDFPGVTQSTTITIPSGGSVRLVSNSLAPLGSVTKEVVGKGTYTLDTTTGVLTFAPVASFVGVAPSVSFEVTDEYGQSGYATYTPTVVPPTAPAITARTSTGVSVAAQVPSTSIVLPTDGSIRLVDVGGGVIASNTLTVPNQGTYTLNRTTGVITFQPVLGFTGVASPVRWRVWDSFNQSSNITTYTPTVAAPSAPSASPKTSTGPRDTAQTVTVTPPSGGSVRLLDGSNNVVTGDSLTVSGEGTYTINHTTGLVTFTPEAGYFGVPTTVSYRVIDAYNQTADSTYSPEVLPEAVPLTSTGVGTEVHTKDAAVPAGSSICLLDGSLSEVVGDSITNDEGTYTLNRTTGVITFTPVLGFTGTGAGVRYQLTDGSARTSSSTYTPTVTAPAPPTASPLHSEGPMGQSQTAQVTLPAGSRARLWNGSAEVTQLVISGQGTYEIDTTTGLITFTPIAGFHGTPAPATYQLTDAYDQSVRSTYEPLVTGSGSGAEPIVDSAKKGAPVTVAPLGKVTPPTGETVNAGSLVVISGKKSGKKITTAEGTWQVNGSKVKFTPSKNFVGVATVSYQVRSSSGRKLRSTISIIVKGTAHGSAKATVYFGIRSAKLTPKALAAIKALARKVPSKATTRALSIGYVQPEAYKGNDTSLSTQRAQNVAGAISKLVKISAMSHSGKGRAKETSARARRATATVYWTMVQK